MLKAREEEAVALLCTLSVDHHRSDSGIKRFMQGNEPILTLEGKAIVDSEGRPSYVTTAGASPSTDKFLLMAYLPAEYAETGMKLLVYYMAESYPVTVEVVGSRPLFDPSNTRMKG